MTEKMTFLQFQEAKRLEDFHRRLLQLMPRENALAAYSLQLISEGKTSKSSTIMDPEFHKGICKLIAEAKARTEQELLALGVDMGTI